MSTAPTPAPSPGLTRNEFFGGLAFLAVVLIAGLAGLAVLMRGPAAPSPVDPIPASARAYIANWAAACIQVGTENKGKPNPDVAGLRALMGAARKGADEQLAADILRGDAWSNLIEAGQSADKLIGVKP